MRDLSLYYHRNCVQHSRYKEQVINIKDKRVVAQVD